MTDSRTALVLFSGGQDSTVCLAHALATYSHVETVGFDYGQTHRVELDCRLDVLAQIRADFPDWAIKLGDDHVLALPALADIGGTALTGDGEIRVLDNSLPSTFVPGRNLLFLTYAAAIAYRRGLSVLVGGMCETDYSGYPDCRRDTLDHLAKAISTGMDAPIEIETPLMYLDKAATWATSETLGGDMFIDLIREATHSCYRGDRNTRHEWGYGCNDCPACELRSKGYEQWVAQKKVSHDL